MIFGQRSTANGTTALATDTKYVARFTQPQGSTEKIAKLSVYLDGGGSGIGTAAARAIVYTSAGVLLGVGDEVTVTSGTAPGWVDFPFGRAGKTGGFIDQTFGTGLSIAVPPGDYDIGLMVGGSTNVIRAYSGAVGTAASNADTYADGPANPFGTRTSLPRDLSVFATYFKPWVPTINEDDFYYARLPFGEAQAKLLLEGPAPNVQYTALTGWHGTRLDEETGCFAVVNQSGPLTGLIGERLLLTRPIGVSPRRVAVYCHGQADVLQDMSLTRRAFSALGLLNEVQISVRVQVLTP